MRSSFALACACVLAGGCYYPTSVATSPLPDGCIPVTTDGGFYWDAGASGDAAPFPVFSLDAGTTWSSLYRDYFGPSGVASCAGNGACHGGTSQPGYQTSGFLCPAGDASQGCYASMTSVGDGGADLVEPGVSFASDELSQVLCQSDGTGIMPLYCTYYFTTVDIERIGDWVNAGAKDN
jgi:hypothetical protein